MNLWPKGKNKLRKLTIAFFLLYLASFSVSLLLLIRYLKLARLPWPTFINQIKNQNQNYLCPQRVDPSGWTIKDGQIRTFPRCLTVTNSRLGSRLNLDWFFGQNQVRSSTLGNQEDAPLFFNLTLVENGQEQIVFPLLPNSLFPDQSVDLGLTSQTVNFANDANQVSLKIESPFAPSTSPSEENTKLSLAPFFYLTLALENKTSHPQDKILNFSLADAQESKTQDNLQLVYFQDQTRSDGTLALAAPQNPGLTPFLKPYRSRQTGGFAWKVNLLPHSSQSLTLVYAGYLDGPVITDSRLENKKDLQFAYTQWFADIQAVIQFAFANQARIQAKTQEFENNLNQTPLSPQQKWLLSQAFHSYLGNTFLLSEKNSKKLHYFVWEGEFKFLNTLDVAHDYAVLEGLYFPWALKLTLESWRDNAKKDEFGTVIPHDLGLRFHYAGIQAYGISGQETSGMPVEENANFILLSFWYWQQTGDDQFLQDLSPLLRSLVDSLIARDANHNGLADQGIRMTTYDNDGNLALMKGPDGTYLGIKQLAAYLSAGKIFQAEGNTSLPADASHQTLQAGEVKSANTDSADPFGSELRAELLTAEASEVKNNHYATLTHQQAELISQSLKNAHHDYGFLPLSLDQDFTEAYQFNGQTIKGTEEQGIGMITGLFYPALANLDSPILNALIPILADSYQQAYPKCLVKNEKEAIIGLKLAQYQKLGLGWLSHAVIADFIAQKLFNQTYHSEEIYFPLLYDSPAGYSDGQYFKEPFYPPQTSLNFYPRGAALFGQIKRNP